MAALEDSALLLRRIPYGDSSLICHLLTREHGRIALMARGARRPKSSLRASLQPLYRLDIRWKSGRTGMGTLTEAQRLEALLPEAMALEGLELMALIARLYPEGAHEGYAEALNALDFMRAHPAPENLLGAAWLLLYQAGWIGDLEHCWSCGKAVQMSEEMFWRGAHLSCDACGGNGLVSPGLRRSIDGVMRHKGVRLSGRHAADWRQMITLVLREHGVRFGA